MSFLHHDMSPLDPLVLKKQEKDNQKPAQSTRVKSTGLDSLYVKPQTEVAAVKQNGKTVPYDHFSHGGMTLDGATQQQQLNSVETSSGNKKKSAAKSEFEHPTVFNGVSTDGKTRSIKSGLSRMVNPNEPEHRVANEQRQKEDYLKSLKDQMHEQRRQALEQSQSSTDPATSLPIGKDPVVGHSKLVGSVSRPDKYQQKSMNPTDNANTRLARTFERKVDPVGDQTLDQWQQQKEQQIRRRNEEKQE
ncbi:hypothetical protein MP228_005103 [Amoeboaphelidium protococcarum]|nr:hypothetical protein MP228_005103 [Amoeboaphelidium protococcarum]